MRRESPSISAMCSEPCCSQRLCFLCLRSRNCRVEDAPPAARPPCSRRLRPNQNHGCVVVESGSVCVPANVLDETLGGCLPKQQVLFEALRSVLFLFWPTGFSDAIAIEQEARAFGKFHRAFGKLCRHQTERRSLF